MQKHEVDVCVVGGGPAGMIAGLLLSKAGIKTLVLEQHRDFEREYRGEVLMPRFTQMMRQIGLFSYLEKFPHLKLTALEGNYRNHPFFRIGFDKISPEVPFAIWMPQPVLLKALYQKVKEYPAFDIWFDARAEKLIQENGKSVGLVAERNREETEVRAKVVIGADGRFSMVRKLGHFEMAHESHGVDIIWFTVEQPAGYDNKFRFDISPTRNYLILPKYPNHLQIGVVVPKGEYAKYHKRGIESLRRVLMGTGSPIVQEFARTLKDFHPFNVLQATIERVKDWAKPGIVLVGDSAHTCSPAGAIGVSVATASAIVAAEVVIDCFRRNDFSENALSRVQEIRQSEVLEIHSIQERFTALLRQTNPFMRQIIMPLALFTIAKLGLFRAFQRRLMVMEEPLLVSKDLGFPN